MKVKITRGKFNGINACADNRGVIAALAVDHRGNLLDAIARARGEHGQVIDDNNISRYRVLKVPIRKEKPRSV